MLPNVDLTGAVKTAERIRQLIHAHSFLHEKAVLPKKLSVSAGVALCHSAVESNQELIQMAESALYQAKREGGNRVCVYDKHLGKDA